MTMTKKMNKKGFTLMEMLIVVAIIAILIAIAIPTFTAQLEKARVAADSANIRSAYALAKASTLTEQDPSGAAYGTGGTPTTTSFTFGKDGSVTGAAYEIKAKTVTVDTVPGQTWTKGKNIVIKWDTDKWVVEANS